MFYWLSKKSENFRISQCITGIKIELQKSTPVRGAKILVISQILRTKTYNSQTFEDVIDNPYKYDRDHLVNFCNSLLDDTFQLEAQFRKHKKDLKLVGLNPNPNVKDHYDNLIKSAYLWIATIGAYILPEHNKNVLTIWETLCNRKNHIPAALQDLQDIEYANMMTAGSFKNPIYTNLTLEECIIICEYVPLFLAESFKIYKTP